MVTRPGPLNKGHFIKADMTHDELERHRACSSIKTSPDEPSDVP